MKLSECSDADLSRWIAEKLSPSQTQFPFWRRCEVPCDRCDATGANTDRSANCRRCDGFGKVMGRCAGDMVNDPAMTVMLTEKLPAGGVMFVPEEKLWRAFSDYTMEHDDFETTNEVENERLGRAVAEAFAMANGWKDGQQ